MGSFLKVKTMGYAPSFCISSLDRMKKNYRMALLIKEPFCHREIVIRIFYPRMALNSSRGDPDLF